MAAFAYAVLQLLGELVPRATATLRRAAPLGLHQWKITLEMSCSAGNAFQPGGLGAPACSWPPGKGSPGSQIAQEHISLMPPGRASVPCPWGAWDSHPQPPPPCMTASCILPACWSHPMPRAFLLHSWGAGSWWQRSATLIA